MNDKAKPASTTETPAKTAAAAPAAAAEKAAGRPKQGVVAMPKAFHDDQAKQRAATTRFDGSRYRRKTDR